MDTHKTKIQRNLIGFLGLLLIAQLANAQNLIGTAQGLMAPATDPFVKLLAAIFGDLGGFGGFSTATDATALASSATLAGKMLITFNSFLMTLTGIWLTWLFFKGTLNSAHDGEFLGKKYHSAWVPLRTAMGVITIMPMPFLHGWNLAQAFYGACILVGINIANGAAVGAVSYMDISSKQGVDIAAMPKLDWFYDKVNQSRANIATLQNEMIRRKQAALGLDANNKPILDADGNPIEKMDLSVDNVNMPEFATRVLGTSKNGRPLFMAVDYGSKEGFETSGYPTSIGTVVITFGNPGNGGSAIGDYFSTSSTPSGATSEDTALDTLSLSIASAVSAASYQYVQDVDAAYSKLMTSLLASSNCSNAIMGTGWSNFSKFTPESGAFIAANLTSSVDMCQSISYAATIENGSTRGFSKEQADYDARMTTLNKDLAFAKNKANESIKVAILGADKTGKTSGALKTMNAATLSDSQKMINSKGWIGIGMVLPTAALKSSKVQEQANASGKEATGKQMAATVQAAVGATTTADTDAISNVFGGFEEPANGKPLLGSLPLTGALTEAQAVLAELSKITTKGLNIYISDRIKEDKHGFEGFLQKASNSNFEGNGGALSQMIAIGHGAINMGSSLLTGLFLILGLVTALAVFSAVAVNLTGAVAFGGSVISAYAMIAMPLALFLYTAGISLTVVLPFIPMMYWLATIASMLFVYVEAILAAPLWAFAHLEDEGDGMGSASKRGYVFIFSLLFGPVILVIGYTASMSIFELLSSMGGSFISKGAVAILQQSEGFFETIAIVVGLISVLFSMHYMLIKICFGQAIQILQKVLSMIGGEWGSNVVPEADGGIQGAEHRSKGGMGVASAGAAAAGRQLGEMFKGDKDKNGGGGGGGQSVSASGGGGGGSSDTSALGDAAKNMFANRGGGGENPSFSNHQPEQSGGGSGSSGSLDSLGDTAKTQSSEQDASTSRVSSSEQDASTSRVSDTDWSKYDSPAASRNEQNHDKAQTDTPDSDAEINRDVPAYLRKGGNEQLLEDLVSDKMKK